MGECGRLRANGVKTDLEVIGQDLMDELEELGFGSDVDALESYVMSLQDAAGNGDREVVMDAVYDRHKRLLEKLKPDSVAIYRNWETDDEEYTNNDVILERYGMKSIHTMTCMEDLSGFKQKLSGIGAVDMVASVKLNGHGVRAVYRDGTLVDATTRGRYKRGRSILRHVKACLPEHIEKWEGTGLIEVRGEILVSKETFREKLSSTLKTPLSSVTSLIRDSASDKEIEMLDMVCYKCIKDDGSSNNSQFGTLEKEYMELKGAGIQIPECIMVNGVTAENFDSKIKSVIAYFEKLYDTGKLKYDCDGIVVSVNDLDTLYSMGEEGNSLIGNFALKMGRVWESNKYCGIVEDIEWVPNKKYITPKAHISPVKAVTGAEIRTVPLYNIGVMQRLQIGIGSRVYFKFGGETGVTLVTPDGEAISGLD